MQFLLVGAAVVALDQVSKAWVMETVASGGVRPVIPGLLELRPVQNSGAAFGLFPDRPLLFVGVALAAVGIMVYSYLRLRGRRPWAGGGLVLASAGALGNLLDRLRFGYVRDFFDVRWYPAIFNVADLALVAGVGLLVLSIFREGEG